METTRLSINVNKETAKALKELAHNRQISVTEAVRRAVAIAKFVEDETDRGHSIHVVAGDATRELKLI